MPDAVVVEIDQARQHVAAGGVDDALAGFRSHTGGDGENPAARSPEVAAALEPVMMQDDAVPDQHSGSFVWVHSESVRG